MNVDVTRSFPRLKNFAKFILEKHVEEFVRDYLQSLMIENPPVLAFVKDISEEQMFQSSLANMKNDFLIPLTEEKGLEAHITGAERWKTYVKTEVNPIDLSISDLIIAYQCRKLSMLKFLPLYEPFSFGMIKEIEDFSKDCEEIIFQTYEEISRNKIEENELFVQKIADASPNILMLYDINTRRAKYISKKVEEVLGYSVDQIINIFNEENNGGIIHPDDLAEIRVKSNHWIESGADMDVLEYRMKHSNGEWRWIRNFQNVFKRDHDGKPTEVVACAIDITDLKNAEDKLKKLNNNLEKRVKEQTKEIKSSYEQVQLIIENFPQLAWTADGDAHIDYFSTSWLKYLGPGYTEMDLKTWGNAIHPDDQKKTIDLWNHSMETGEKYMVENRLFRYPDQSYRWHLSIGVPLRDATGKIFKWVGTSTDIHDQKTANEQLEKMVAERTRELLEANRDLAISNKDLELFAFVASHDLKEPLRMVSNYLELLTQTFDGKLDEEQKEFMSYISSGAVRMNALISDLLNYSRVNRNPGPSQKLNANEIIQIISQNLSIRIAETHTTIKASDLPVYTGIESQQVQLFQNLISNAIKFKHPDRDPIIEISANTDGDNWVFSVKDNGIGIAPKFHDKIFEIFQRLNSSEYPGTGIGLSICKKVAELNGGKIWYDSVEGVGSTFHFTIPKAIKIPEMALKQLLPVASGNQVNDHKDH